MTTEAELYAVIHPEPIEDKSVSLSELREICVRMVELEAYRDSIPFELTQMWSMGDGPPTICYRMPCWECGGALRFATTCEYERPCDAALHALSSHLAEHHRRLQKTP